MIFRCAGRIQIVTRADGKLTAFLESDAQLEWRYGVSTFDKTKLQKPIRSSLLRHLYSLSAFVVSVSII